MKLFQNQTLKNNPHIAIFSSRKVGNFVVITPLLRGLKEKYHNCTIDFFGSEITKDFEVHCPYIDWRFSLYTDRTDFLESIVKQIGIRRQLHGTYDLAINCDEFSELNLVMITAIRPSYIAGTALSRDFSQRFTDSSNPIQKMLSDRNWNSLDFVRKYQTVINSNYISEIFCRIAYVETDFYKLELPSKPPNFIVPDILIHLTATRPAKMWFIEYWQQVVEWCEEQGLKVGLIGSTPITQHNLYHSNGEEDYLLQTTSAIDLRGKTSLLELAGAFRQAKACISVDTGPLHIAAAVGCFTLGIFGNDEDGDGASPIRLWAPRQSHVKIPASNHKCTLCQKNRYKNQLCLLENHPCMNHLKPETVINYLSILISTAIDSTNNKSIQSQQLVSFSQSLTQLTVRKNEIINNNLGNNA
ncbi:MAG: glycosyltransferase family 9 protein [Cyanobacteria bacterium P01_G01_bin.67]